MQPDLLTLLSPKNIVIFVIIFTRIGGMIASAPLFSHYPMPEQVKISEDILSYQKSKRKLQFTHKYYDSEEKKFNVKIKVVCGHHKSIFDDKKIIEEDYLNNIRANIYQ